MSPRKYESDRAKSNRLLDIACPDDISAAVALDM